MKAGWATVVITIGTCLYLLVTTGYAGDSINAGPQDHSNIKTIELKTNKGRVGIECKYYDNRKRMIVFPNIDTFKTAFLKENIKKDTFITIAGMWDYPIDTERNEKLNEALLSFIRENGYEESLFKITATGNSMHRHISVSYIYWKSKSKIRWRSSQVIGDRIVRGGRDLSSLDDFKDDFGEGKIDKQTEITVSYYKDNFASTETAKTIFKYLQEEGYRWVSLYMESGGD